MCAGKRKQNSERERLKGSQREKERERSLCKVGATQFMQTS